MKISIGMKLRTGPWGGSNQFGVALAEYLTGRGVEVCFDLNAPNIDLILMTDPRKQGLSVAYTPSDILAYLLRTNRRTLVVHRINECDERKGTTDVNAQLIRANYCADHTVFISGWLRELFLRHGLQVAETSSVIWNGADHRIFHANGYAPWDRRKPLKLITHHFGANHLKGFDIYAKLDQLLADPTWRQRIAFTFIGNLPTDVRLEHSTCLSPLHGAALADAIRQHHVYLTASQNEPAGMHHIEGALCGLPLLYRESGALPEYCQGFGLSFTPDNFEQRLQEMLDTYENWLERMPAYATTSDTMCQNYYQLFRTLLTQRDDLLTQRKRQRKIVSWNLTAARDVMLQIWARIMRRRTR